MNDFTDNEILLDYIKHSYFEKRVKSHIFELVKRKKKFRKDPTRLLSIQNKIEEYKKLVDFRERR